MAKPDSSHPTASAVPPGGRLVQLLQRVRAEYNEMPGLCLTAAQAQRLWSLDSETCDLLLAALVDIGYLRRGRHGYVRACPRRRT